MLPSRSVPAPAFGVAVPPMLNPAALNAPAGADPQALPDFASQLGQARLPQPQPPQAAAAPPAPPQAQDADAGAPRAGAQAKQAAGSDPAAERQAARQREARAQAQKKAASAPTVPAQPAQAAAGDEDEARRAARPVGNARTELDDDQQTPAAVPTTTTTAGSAPLPDTAGPALVTAHANLPQAPAPAAGTLGDAGEDSSPATPVGSPAHGGRGAVLRHGGGNAAADPALMAASAAAPEPRLEAGTGGPVPQAGTEAAAPVGPAGSAHPGAAGTVSAAAVGSSAAAGVAGAAQAGDATSFQAQLSAALGSPEFAPALGLQISVLARDGIEQARLQLNPAEMGPIDVRIALDGNQARVDFQADQAPTRQALQDALPQLAQALQDAGFTLSGGGVSDGSAGRQPHGGAPTGRASTQDTGAAHADAHADAQAVAAVRASAAGTPRSLLDLYA